MIGPANISDDSMWVSKIGPAVAAGNAMILKSSEKSPLSVRVAVELLCCLFADAKSSQSLYLSGLSVEAGFPPGIIQVLSGLGDTGKLLSEHMEIRKISFTGSTRTGRFGECSFLAGAVPTDPSFGQVAAGAAMSNLKSVSLELGGKSPTCVLSVLLQPWTH